MPRESRTTYRPGTKGRAFRGATLIRRCRTLVTDGWLGARPAADRRCPVSLALCAGAYWRSAFTVSRSVRRLPGPFLAVVVPARTSRRISGSTCDGYSSRSQPVVRDVARSMGGRRAKRQARGGAGGAGSRRTSNRRSARGRRAATRAPERLRQHRDQDDGWAGHRQHETRHPMTMKIPYTKFSRTEPRAGSGRPGWPAAGRHGPVDRLEAGTAHDRKRRIPRVAAIRLGQPAQPERRAARRLDPSRVPAGGAQPGDGWVHAANGASVGRAFPYVRAVRRSAHMSRASS